MIKKKVAGIFPVISILYLLYGHRYIPLDALDTTRFRYPRARYGPSHLTGR
jgi:hypothetical protein